MVYPATNNAPGRINRLLSHLDAFVGFARKRVGEAALAEDVVQDALAKALAHVHEVRDDEKVDAWFYRILRRTISDLIVRREHRTVELDDLPENSEELAVACACINDLINDLDPDYRDAVRLVDIEGISASEAARQLGITETNLKVRRHRARDQLHDLLNKTCRVCAKHGCLDCSCQPRAQ